MIDKYVLAAAIAIFLVFISYVGKFYFSLDYGVSSDPAVWGQLGDYLGGLLNPVLSFISLVLLIKSLNLQNEANQSLRSELKSSEKTEKIRSFEVLFFNMINSQKELFNSFAVEIVEDGKRVVRYGVDGAIAIEDEIERIQDKSNNDEEVRALLEEIDSKDQIFGIVRVFYIIVRMISERLCESEGFGFDERKAHFNALVNFTDFAQLRLIMISMRFMDFESTKYLKGNREFNDVLTELGLDISLY